MMKKNIENLLYKVADMEFMSHDDELSKLIASELNDELSEDMLEFVSAASGPDYDKFQRYLENSNNK